MLWYSPAPVTSSIHPSIHPTIHSVQLCWPTRCVTVLFIWCGFFVVMHVCGMRVLWCVCTVCVCVYVYARLHHSRPTMVCMCVGQSTPVFSGIRFVCTSTNTGDGCCHAVPVCGWMDGVQSCSSLADLTSCRRGRSFIASFCVARTGALHKFSVSTAARSSAVSQLWYGALGTFRAATVTNSLICLFVQCPTTTSMFVHATSVCIGVADC